MKKKASKNIVPVETVQDRILLVRGQKVMLDSDLAALYGVPTKRLNEQVKRNRERFPDDFMFQLTTGEKTEVVAICDHLQKLKFSPTLPYAFTEHGALMLASVLNSSRAVQMSIFVVRSFIKLREILASHQEMMIRLDEIEQRVGSRDMEISRILKIIRRLAATPKRTTDAIGFQLTSPRLGKVGKWESQAGPNLNARASGVEVILKLRARQITAAKDNYHGVTGLRAISSLPHKSRKKRFTLLNPKGG